MRLIFVFIILFGGVLPAQAGWTSNGGDLIRDRHNPWFLGDETVEYCVRKSGDFPIEEADLKPLVARSLSKWVDFFTRYQIDRAQLGDGDTHFADGTNRKLGLKFSEINNCADEPVRQILFIFGNPNSVVDSVLRTSGQSLALAVRKDYDHRSYRTGGIVWVSGFNQVRATAGVGDVIPRIEHLLLHEIGHVFGMRHDSVFVMDSFIADDLVAPDWESEHRGQFGNIESPSWKYRPLVGDSMNLSYNKGGFMGIGAGLQANAEIPSEIRRETEISNTGFFRLFLEAKAFTRNMTEFDLILQASGRAHRFVGNFPATPTPPKMDLGPGVWTRWFTNPALPDFREARTLIDKIDGVFPSRGYFEFNSKKYPALITNERGPKLEIFTPESGLWWTQKNFRKTLAGVSLRAE